MPNSTSACGLPLVRMAWFTTWPASPPWMSSTSMPVSSVKASSTPSLRRNESWVSRRTVPDPVVVAPLSVSSPHPHEGQERRAR